MYAEVLVEIKAKQLDKTFTYSVPKCLENKIKIGIRVSVPFGNRVLEGFVLNIKKEKQNFETKEIISLIDVEPVLNDEMLLLGKYISKKYLCNLISAYQTMLPTALKAKKNIQINKKFEIYYKKINDLDKPTFKQKQILDLFENELVSKKVITEISDFALKKLVTLNVLQEVKLETYRLNNSYKKEEKNINLNVEQIQVITEVTNNLNVFKPYLLHGVTGSGKTEVYMNIIKTVLLQNKEVIVLVPEISLTPQLVNVFKNRFGEDIAILHSGLSDGEKYDEWRRIERKEVKIVIGARSAIYAPFTNIGMIIIDEEHSSTYKQENNPKYHAIDIALYRAKIYNCPVLLGSATPTIESFTRAKMGIYTLLSLPNRVNNNMPDVTLIDMKDEIKKGNKIFSKPLQDKINSCLEKDEQVILLLNRRGFSTIISCKNCGFTQKCPNCDIPLTYHKQKNKMLCHYCNYIVDKLKKCPECQSNDINEFGLGTEKLEQLVQENFKLAKVIRMDVDTTKKKGSLDKIITDFKDNKYNVLIGTQMISKGLDFPNVTLVGVINADASLNIPDFRSGERTYQLLSQVAGRSGRSNLKGQVIMQGFNMNHYSILKAQKHDYMGFYNEEMAIRKLLKYPPFYNLSLIKISGLNFEEVNTEANKIYNYLLETKTIVLGPSPSMIPKINNTHYLQVIVKYKKFEQISQHLEFINNKYKNSKVNVEIDINYC